MKNKCKALIIKFTLGSHFLYQYLSPLSYDSRDETINRTELHTHFSQTKSVIIIWGF